MGGGGGEGGGGRGVLSSDWVVGRLGVEYRDCEMCPTL